MITRFAPSPTGPLHLGHAYSALLAHDTARAAGGSFLLRIEDTDSTRSRPDHEARILDDLTWLGCTWDDVRRQSDHLYEYWSTLSRLDAQGLLFPCDCSRRRIQDTGAGNGPDGPIYPGTCANRSMADARPTDAIRLNLRKAAAILPATLNYTETGEDAAGQHRVQTAHLVTKVGAPVLRRITTGDAAYHLACVHDDARQGVTHVIRGLDVTPLTPIHVVLQHLMGWPTPIYHHHRLITDESGERLAKINHSKSIAAYRAEGATPADIRRLIGLPVERRH